MKICVHTLVKNEDMFLWFAIKSVIDHVDRIMLWDTGSTDNTISICEDLKKKYPDKIFFEKYTVSSPGEVTLLRQKMLEATKEDWILIVDGDEVWWEDSILNLVDLIKSEGEKLDSIVTPFVNLIGDMYHYQPNNLGKYQIDDKVGFLTIRAFSNKIMGLHVKNTYPLEGYFNSDGEVLQKMNQARRVYLDKPFLHLTHLPRSSRVKSKKRKHESGLPLPLDYFYPESFFEGPPSNYDFWKTSTLQFKLKSGIITPAKKIKRSIKKR